ncbi:hypothetical protein BYT27DRAFT_7240198 [Phlegmacium glaucopus]|nr:hypothetical protein BYT27DRAFT_7240198 [Phlegmacium glaucopus]
MDLSSAQLSALHHAKKILDNAGLLAPNSPGHGTLHPDVHLLSETIAYHLPSSPSPAIQLSLYKPQVACPFTYKENLAGINLINRQTRISALVDHPMGSIVKYPQTGSCSSESIAHRFTIDPNNFIHPKANIQYSLGDSHGGISDVFCHLLKDKDGNSVPTMNLKTQCKGLKICPASVESSDSHYFTSRHHVFSPIIRNGGSNQTANEEVFTKTLAFYCALIEKGCGFDAKMDASGDFQLTDELEIDSLPEFECGDQLEVEQPQRKGSSSRTCSSRIVLKTNQYGQPFVQTAAMDLFFPVTLVHHQMENSAVVYCGADKAINHVQHSSISIPLLIFHPAPRLLLSVKILILMLLLFPLKLLHYFWMSWHQCWKLADITPRKAMLDLSFMFSLRKHLGWNKVSNATLSDLHPSLENLDHVRRHINILRNEFFPCGTGWNGAVQLCNEHKKLPLQDRYVRCAETHTIEKGREFSLVICMSPAMSQQLMNTTCPSINTSFKHLHGSSANLGPAYRHQTAPNSTIEP